jgi:hypothetical protein
MKSIGCDLHAAPQTIRQIAVEVQDAQRGDGFIRQSALGANGIHQPFGRKRGSRFECVLQQRQRVSAHRACGRSSVHVRN